MVDIQLAKNLTVPSEKLFSYHLALAGMTGSGKSRNVSATLLKECLENKPKNQEGIGYAYIVIDTNSEYFTFQDAYPKQVIVFSPDITKGIPFRISSQNITVDDISIFLKEITKREVSKSDTASLFLAIDELRAKGDYTLEQIYTKLYELEAYSILPSFEKMMRTEIFGPQETPLSLLVRQGEASIIDIGGYSTEIQAIIFAHLARRLFQARVNKEVPPILLWMEEASVFCPEGRFAPSSPIVHTIATQGRGYDFILISIFQRSALTDITLRSQSHGWIIGKTGNPLDRQAIMKAAEKIETEHDRVIKNLVVGRDFLVTGLMVDEPKVAVIPDLKILARKGGRIAQKNIEESFKRGDLASYIETIRQVEATQHKQMEETITKLRLEREAEVKAPKIPKEAQQEIEKLKSSHEKIKKRYEEAMERASVHAKEKYEGRVKELEAELERLTKQLTLKGVQAETVWDHPLVQKRLSDKLTDQQRNLVQFIEKAGPSGPEKIAAFLGCAPKTVPGYISKINKSISNLIDSQSGTYYSRLSQVFPVTEAAKRESEELKRLRDELAHLTKERDDLQQKISAVKKESDGASQSVVKIQKLEGDVRERESRIAQLTRDLAESNNKSREMGRAYSQLKGELEEFNEKLKAYENLQSAIQTITGKVDRDQIHKIAVDEVRRAATEIKGDKNTESIGEDRVRELIRREMAELPTPQATGILSPQSMEALETKIISEVMSRVSSSPNVVVVQPKDALLKDVLKREVEIVKGAVEQLPDKSKLMLGFLASSDKAVSIQELMTRFAGSDGGEQRRKYVDPIRALDTVVKYDKGHGKLTYIWRDTLKSAYPSLTDEELNAAISQVYHILSQKITVRDSP